MIHLFLATDLTPGATAQEPDEVLDLHVLRWSAVRTMIRRTSVKGYLDCAGAFLGLALEDRIHLIKARTLYLSGADDHRGGPSPLMAGLAAKVPGARHAAVPDAAHIANIQNPAGFNHLLMDFLK